MKTGTGTNRELVLIVSTAVRGTVARAAEGCGFAVDVVRDVSQAVAHLRRRRYRAVLVDLDAADVDSLELVLNVRDFDPTVPIVVMAAVWDATNMTTLGAQPGTMLVAKPGNVADLSDDLARLSLNKITAGQLTS